MGCGNDGDTLRGDFKEDERNLKRRRGLSVVISHGCYVKPPYSGEISRRVPVLTDLLATVSVIHKYHESWGAN